MSFIEGVGDEVTAFFVILVVVALAALVTLISNGSHLYSTTSITISTRTLPVQLGSSSQQAPQNEIPSREPSENNRNVHSSNNSLGSARENRYQDITSNEARPTEMPNSVPPLRNRNSPRTYGWIWSSRDGTTAPIHEEETEDISEDTEDQNSSDETRVPEAHLENQEDEAAPTEETCNEETEQETTESNVSGIRIRLKYLDDTERTVRSNPTAIIAEFKRNHFSEDLSNNKIVRLIFCGHLLRDNATLESYRVVDNSVIHVQVLQAQTDHNRSPVSQNTELDLSTFLWPLVSIILGVCWVFYFKYPEFFNLISIGLLFLFTSGFVFMYSQLRVR